MRYRDSVYILKACQMSFNGVKNNDIAKELGVPRQMSRDGGNCCFGKNSMKSSLMLNGRHC